MFKYSSVINCKIHNIIVKVKNNGMIKAIFERKIGNLKLELAALLDVYYLPSSQRLIVPRHHRRL
jgi:hypothetical protein